MKATPEQLAEAGAAQHRALPEPSFPSQGNVAGIGPQLAVNSGDEVEVVEHAARIGCFVAQLDSQFFFGTPKKGKRGPGCPLKHREDPPASRGVNSRFPFPRPTGGRPASHPGAVPSTGARGGQRTGSPGQARHRG